MILRVHTARVGYGGADVLDVTRKGRHPRGVVFAPSWALLAPALDLRRLAAALRASADDARVDQLEAASWLLYEAGYRAEMRVSYRAQRPRWDALLAAEEVTLVCFCVEPQWCHRRLLAEILAKLGARDEGERLP